MLAHARQPRGKSHGLSKTKEYRTWENMKKRCYCKTNPRYPDWGGRGITVCDRWKDSFLTFLADMGKAPSPDHTIERKENNKGYSQENCRWAHKSEQAANTRRSVLLTYAGLTLTMPQWEKKLGLPDSCLRKRLHRGWSLVHALTTPANSGMRRDGVNVEYQGRTQSLSAWAKELNLRLPMLSKRLLAGWPVDKAFSTPSKKASQQLSSKI